MTRVSLVYCKTKHNNIQVRTQYYSQLSRPFTCKLRTYTFSRTVWVTVLLKYVSFTFFMPIRS